MESLKQESPAAGRNREPILAALRDVLPERGLVLEVASGSGEHARWFAAALPRLRWQPTEREADRIASIAAWRADGGTANLLLPLMLDAARPELWPVARADAVVSVNLVHIAPASVGAGLLRGAAAVLPTGAPLVLYGPFREQGVPLAEGNAAFDADLRARDPEWGLRWLHEVAADAAAQGLRLAERRAMPANNLFVVFRKATV